MTTTRNRRAGEQAFHWLLAARFGSESTEKEPAETSLPKIEIFSYRPDDGYDRSPDGEWHERIGSRPAMLLLDIVGEDALLIPGAGIRKLPRLAGGSELMNRASEGARAWARRLQQVNFRLQLPERLTEFAEALAAVQSESDVCAVLVEHSARIVDGYSSLLLLRRADDASSGMELRLVDCTAAGPAIPDDPHFRHPGIVRCEEARADTGAPFPDLADYFQTTGAVMLAHVPFGDEGVLFVSERRQNRTFEAEHWDLFRSIARQALCALQRVRSLEEVKQLSLTDPLTGIGNRRRLEVTMDQAWAAARRGEPLSILMIDLDRFKRINDSHGHAAGDRVLKEVGAILKEEARGSDIVVRYGGDEFLVVLQGTGASGAYMLSKRVRERLKGIVGVTVGFAEYHPSFARAEELIEAADRNMLKLKRDSAEST